MLYTIDFDASNKIYYRRSTEPLFENRSVVEIGYNTIPKGAKQAFKRDVYIIHYVTGGKGRFMNIPFEKGHCYFVSAGELEVVESTDDESYECYWIMVKGKNAKELLKNCGLPEHNSVFEFEYAGECGKIIEKYLFEEKYESELAEACRLEEALYALLSLHIKALPTPTAKPKADIKVQAIADYIESNYRNDIKISDLCQVFYFSKNHLCTLFKRKYGLPPKEYLIWYRLLKAKTLLRDENCNMSISEISSAVGIGNPMYFSRLFHEKEGMSPTDYRNKLKNFKI